MTRMMIICIITMLICLSLSSTWIIFLTGHKAASKLDQATNQDRHLDDHVHDYVHDHDDNDYTHDDYEAEEGGDDEDKYGNYHDHGDDDYYHYDDL